MVAVPANFDQSTCRVYDVLGAFVVEASVEHADQQLEHRRPQHVLEVNRVHGQVSEDERDGPEVLEFLVVFGRVDAVDVVGQGSEDLLVIFEEERVVVVDAVEDQHVQGINHVLPAHEGIEAEDDLLCFGLADVQLSLLQVEQFLRLLFLLESPRNLVLEVHILLIFRLSGGVRLILADLPRCSEYQIGELIVILAPEIVAFFVWEEILQVKAFNLTNVFLPACLCGNLRPFAAIGHGLYESKHTWKPPLRQTSW